MFIFQLLLGAVKRGGGAGEGGGGTWLCFSSSISSSGWASSGRRTVGDERVSEVNILLFSPPCSTTSLQLFDPFVWLWGGG